MYRVGKKQQRAVLDEKGREIVIFPTGKEKEAQEYCGFLNHNHPKLNNKLLRIFKFLKLK